MPPPVQQRYNAKARGSVAGGSHKKRKRPKTHRGEVEPGQDGEPSVAKTESEDGIAGRGKMSSKKRKRLDSYINKKLKNEEKSKTLKLLASLTPSSSTSAALASSSTLGQKPLAPSSAQERMDVREDRLVRKGIDRISKRGGGRVENGDEERSETDSSDGERTISTIPIVSTVKSVNTTTNGATGIGRKQKSWNPELLPTQPESDSSDFDSSDSDNGADDVGEPVAITANQSTSVTEAKEATPESEDTKLISVDPPTAPATTSNTGSALARVTGGALKRGVDGGAVQPRVIQRRQKMPLGRNIRGAHGDDEIEGESSSSASRDSDSEMESDGSHDDESSVDGSVSEEDATEEVEEGSDTSDVEQPEDAKPIKKRSLGFKAWALKQMGQEAPSRSPSTKPSPPPFAQPQPTVETESSAVVSRTPAIGPLGAQLQIPLTSLMDIDDESLAAETRPTIKRSETVAEARLNLPILAEEQAIVEAIRMNPVVMIAGETGSGKTTQVPQMLYEAGFGCKSSNNPGMIAITQPRRVAAVSLSARVREELCLPPSSPTVAHQIRYSSTTSPETCIKFMTDGVLLREMAKDFLLSRYSVVVVDEAHERGVNTDVLVGLLSRAARLREKKWREAKEQKEGGNKVVVKPLRIVIMSATLRISDFSSNTTLFASPPPVVHIPARQHPVTVHFSRKTVSDYIGEAYKKVCKIHARLPPGGILVFLTGQGEIQGLCRKLEANYGKGRTRKSRSEPTVEDARVKEADTLHKDVAVEADDVELGQDVDLAEDVDDGAAESDPEALDSDDDDDVPDIVIQEETEAPMHVLPLYSLLSNDQQMKVFQPPPPGHRLVIVATNVAETSLTIPGIRYVVDSGRSKERHFDPGSGVQSFQVSWISKASAAQRAGRAGRTGPGHVYRLYSSALFEDHFEAYSKPEILRMPIEGVVLQMKSMNIDSVVNFPFPTPPDRSNLAKAERLLMDLGALEKPSRGFMVNGVMNQSKDGGRITPLGNAMAGYPVSPRFAKMLVIGNQHDCLPFVIAIVACLSVGDPFVHEQSLELGDNDGDDEEEIPAEMSFINKDELRQKEEKKRLRSRYFKAHAQFTSLGGGRSDLFKMLAAIGAYEYEPDQGFCSRNFLRAKAMQEIQQLRRQISRIASVPLTRLDPPSETQLKVLRQVILASSLDRVAVRLDVAMKQPSTSFSSSRNIPYRAIGLSTEEPAYIHPSSTLFHKPPPEFLVFQEITRGEKKTYLKGITSINPRWLSEVGKGMCTWSKPEEMKVKGRGKGDDVKEGEREVWVVPHFGDLGVDLPAKRMKQRREGTRWVLVE